MSRKIFVLFISIFLTFDFSFSQDAKINVISNNDSVSVFLDTLFLGKTPVLNFAVSSGSYILKGISKKIGRWDNEIVEISIRIKPGDSSSYHLNFRKSLKLITNPENAKVFINNTFVGYSPINIFYNKTDTISIKKENYEIETFTADSIKNGLVKNGLVKIALSPEGRFQQDNKIESLVKKNGSNKTIYYLISGGMALGVFAVLMKINADDLETEYRSNHNQDLKSKIRTYDTVSGVSLMLFEACFLTLSYLLLSN
jgi:hypothetical protein